MMKYRLLLCATAFLLAPPAFGQDIGAPTKPNIYAKDARSQALAGQKKQVDIDAQKRIKERSKARKIQAGAELVVQGTGEINEFLFHLPLVVRQQHPTAAVAILNQIVRGVSIGVRGIARRNCRAGSLRLRVFFRCWTDSSTFI